MVSPKYFLVSYDRLDEHVIAELTQKEREAFVGYAVQPQVPKVITARLPMVNEWELPWYDPHYQEAFYAEYSAMVHLVQNRGLTDGATHIGLFHYDVFFRRNIVTEINEKLEQTPEMVLYVSRIRNHIYFNPWAMRQICAFLSKRLQMKIRPGPIREGGWVSTALSITPIDVFRTFARFVLEYHEEIEDFILSNRWGIMWRVKHRNCGLIERMWGFYLVSLGLPLQPVDVVHEWDNYQHAHRGWE